MSYSKCFIREALEELLPLKPCMGPLFTCIVWPLEWQIFAVGLETIRDQLVASFL